MQILKLTMLKTLTIRPALYLLVLFMGLFQLKAQVSDFQLRTGLQLSGNVSKKTRWRVETESRFENNASQLDRILIEPTIAYRFQKFMSVGGGYRWTLKFDNETNNVQQNRVHGDVAFHHKIKSLEFKFRTRVQYDLKNLNQNQNFNFNDLYYRHALSMDYNIFGSRFTPSASIELFHNIDNTKSYRIEKYRYTASVDYRLTRNASLSAFYMIDDEVNVKKPKTYHIIGCSVGYRFR